MEHLRVKYKAGEALFKEGEAYDAIFLLEKGRVTITNTGKKLGTINADDGPEFVGEISALLGMKRTASVVAETECTAVRLPVAKLEDVLLTVPSLGVKLARSLARKLNNADGKIEANHDFARVFEVQLKHHVAKANPASAQALWDFFRKNNPWSVGSFDVETPKADLKVAGKK